MFDTSPSLMQRLRNNPKDNASWKRLVDLYTPFLRGWMHRHGVKPQNAEDVLQDVFAVLLRELPKFEYDRKRGTFRGWLRMVLTNRLRELWRDRQPQAAGGDDVGDVLNQLQDPNSNLSQLWAVEHDQFVARRLLELIEGDFEPLTWRAFQRQVMDGKKAPEVAVELGISVGAAYVAKSRVMHRLKEEMQGMTG